MVRLNFILTTMMPTKGDRGQFMDTIDVELKLSDSRSIVASVISP